MSKTKQSAANAAARRKAMLAASGIERAKPAAAAAPLGRGRAGRKGVVIYLTPLAKDELATIAHEHKKTIQQLGVEAINLLLRSYRRKPIA